MSIRKLISRVIIFWIALIIIIAELYVRNLIRTHLAVDDYWMAFSWFPFLFMITPVYNAGGPMGTLQNTGNLLAIFALFVVSALVYFSFRIDEREYLYRIALGFLLGGAVGNLIERIFHNGVVVSYFVLLNLTVYSISDLSITVGSILMIISAYLSDRKKSPSQ